MKQILYLVIFLLTTLSFCQNEPLFEEGKALYKAEKYQEAVVVWMKILDKNEHSSSLYFNLGNAHYKLNSVGPSIYYYEKALQLSPHDTDVKNNLAFAQNAMVDNIEPLPVSIFTKWYKTISGGFNYNEWALAAVVFSISFVVLFLLYYFSFSETRKRLLFASSLISIILLLISISMAFTTFSDTKNDRPAIIFAESIEIKSEPNLGSEVAFILHEGTKVQVVAQDTEWVRIVIADGKDGWIPVTDIKEL